jgi:translation initiation factor 1 (eIF-1/SUI1)
VPAHERIVVRRERKGHGGKAVTIAEGAGLAGHDVSALARDAAKALGTGARVEDGTLVVQGEQTDRLIAWLAGRGFTSVVRGN